MHCFCVCVLVKVTTYDIIQDTRDREDLENYEATSFSLDIQMKRLILKIFLEKKLVHQVYDFRYCFCQDIENYIRKADRRTLLAIVIFVENFIRHFM